MTSAKRQNPTRFIPETGVIYANAGGGNFRCLRGGGYTATALMQNIASGWTCVAHGIVRYEDGTIEWDYSTGGYFDQIEKAETRSRQRSMMNAMLCCMI